MSHNDEPYVVRHFINGSLINSGGERQGDVYNPAQGKVQGQVLLADVQTVNAAIASAKAAFPAWAELSPLRRSRILFKFKELLDKHHKELANVITSEHGKVFTDSMGEVTRGIEIVEFACGAPNLLKTDFSDNIGGGIDNWSLRQPLGVCAGVTPFNFPVMVPLWMIPIALAAGNCFILKPSERDPSASLIIAKLLREAGLPDGVFNVVNPAHNLIHLGEEPISVRSFLFGYIRSRKAHLAYEVLKPGNKAAFQLIQGLGRKIF